MNGKIMEIPVESITWDQGIYPREETHPDVVARYAEAMEAGAQFPPILVVALPDGHHLILDGNHRLQAHRRLGRRVILAQVLDVDPTDRLELVALAAQANMRHGLPLSQEERRMVIQRLYRLGMTIPEMQKRFGIPERTLYRWTQPVRDEQRLEREEKIRKARELAAAGHTQEDIARILGVNRSTIANWLSEPAILAEQDKKQHNLPEASLHEELAARGVRFERVYDHEAFEVPEDVEANRRRLAASRSDPYVSGMYVIDVSLPLFDALEQFEKTITSEKSLEAAVKSDLVRHHIRESLKHIYEVADRIYGIVQSRMDREKIPFDLDID